LIFSRSGELLVSGAWGRITRLWDVRSHQELVNIPGEPLRTAQFGADDRLLPFKASNRQVGIWEIAAGSECRTIHGVGASAAVSPDGRLIACSASDGTRLLDLSTGSELARLPGGPAAIRFHSNGESLVTAGAAGLKCWSIKSDPQTGGLHMRPLLSLGTSAGRTQRLLAEPTGLSLVGDTVAAVEVTRRQVLVFNVRNPDRELVLRADGLLYDVAISPDTRWVATSDWGRRGVRIWDAQNGEVVKDLPVAHNAVAFSPDGQWLVVGNEEEYAFWDVARWRLERRVARVESGDNRGRAVFTPDGRMLAIAHSSTLVKLIDPVSGREFATLPTTGGPVCFSPDGGRLFTSAENDGIHVWDLRRIRQQLGEMGLEWDHSSDQLAPPTGNHARAWGRRVNPPPPLRPLSLQLRRSP
jgi:WD40 repeat protein